MTMDTGTHRNVRARTITLHVLDGAIVDADVARLADLATWRREHRATDEEHPLSANACFVLGGCVICIAVATFLTTIPAALVDGFAPAIPDFAVAYSIAALGSGAFLRRLAANIPPTRVTERVTTSFPCPCCGRIAEHEWVRDVTPAPATPTTTESA